MDVYLARGIGALNLFRVCENHTLALGIHAITGHVIQTQNNILGRYDDRLTACRRKDVVGRHHQHPGLDLCLDRLRREDESLLDLQRSQTGDGAVVVALGTEIGQDRTVRIGNPTNAGMTYAVRDDRSPVFVVRQALLDGFPRSIEELGDVRLTVESTVGAEVFVGIGPASDVDEYLADAPEPHRTAAVGMPPKLLMASTMKSRRD